MKKRNSEINPQRRTRRSADQWRQLMAGYDSSGLTQLEYCARHDIAPGSFAKWRKRLKDDDGFQGQSLTEALFTALPLPDRLPAVPCWDIELDLGLGMTLRLRRS